MEKVNGVETWKTARIRIGVVGAMKKCILVTIIVFLHGRVSYQKDGLYFQPSGFWVRRISFSFSISLRPLRIVWFPFPFLRLMPMVAAKYIVLYDESFSLMIPTPQYLDCNFFFLWSVLNHLIDPNRHSQWPTHWSESFGFSPSFSDESKKSRAAKRWHSQKLINVLI